MRVIGLVSVLMIGLWQGVALASGEAPNVSGPEAPSVDNPPAPETDDAPEAPSAPEEAPSGPSAPSGGSSSTSSQAPAAPQVSQSQPTEDDDEGGHETEDPRRQTHGSGEVLALDVADNEDVVVVGRSNAQVNEDYSSSSDVTVLAVGGEEVIGSHSTSNGSESVGPVIACEESGGQLCVGLLYADTSASEDENSSEARADSAIAFVCLGGDNPTPTGREDCGEAPLTAGVAETHSSASADKTDGSQSSSSHTTLADACLGGQLLGLCQGVGVEALSAQSESSIDDENGNGTTRDDTGETSRSSFVAGLQVAGDAPINVVDPDAIIIGPDPENCFADPGSLLCLFLNQGESFVETGFAGSRQEALHLLFLVSGEIPGGALLSLHAATAESAVLGNDAECPNGFVFDPATGTCLFECPGGELVADPEDCPNGEPRVVCPDGTILAVGQTREDCPGGGPKITERGGGGLALTGGGMLPLLAVSMILAAGGTGALTTERRRRRP